MRILATLLLLTAALPAQRPALIVTTDLGQDPDDQQSMIRLLHYANDLDLRGLIVNADANNDYELPILADTLLHELIDAYGQIENKLHLHDPRYPTSDVLHGLVKRGHAGHSRHVPATDYVGSGRETEGSRWIVARVREAEGPVGIAVWGGGADLAQALWSAERQLSTTEFSEFLGKLRVYFIGKQDSSVEWILERYPTMRAVLALDRGGDKWASTYRGMFLGGDLELTSRRWLDRYILNSGNPLAEMYPTETYTGGDDRNPHRALKEGDSPSFLHFLPNGLNDPERPDLGGWGGRFSTEDGRLYLDASDSLPDGDVSATATVHRWRPAFQRDFAARVNWGVSDFAGANHHPEARIRVGGAKVPRQMTMALSDTITLDATSSTDVDGDRLFYRWYTYPKAVRSWEATTDSLTLTLPPSASPGQEFHLILEVTDDGSIPLTAYRRLTILTEAR